MRQEKGAVLNGRVRVSHIVCVHSVVDILIPVCNGFGSLQSII